MTVLNYTNHSRILDTVLYKGTKDSAGIDVFSVEDVSIERGGFKLVNTGVTVQPERNDLVGLLFLRSSMASKGLILMNSVGIIDADFTGEIKMIIGNLFFKNGLDTTYHIKKGDRIGQLIYVQYEQMNLEEVLVLRETKRGTGGFGSTGR